MKLIHETQWDLNDLKMPYWEAIDNLYIFHAKWT